MSNTIQSGHQARIESIARSMPPKAQEDMRQLLTSVIHNLTALSPGGNLLEIGGAQANASKPPTGVTHTVQGANAQYTVGITNPSSPQGTQIWHEISYSPLKSFTQGRVTMEPTTDTSVQIPSPGGSFFFRLRSSFDKKTWSNYQYASTSPVKAGLVSSAATSSGGAFNQTNFAEVNSQAAGTSAAVTISGVGGLLSAYTAVKGAAQQVRPSATIVGVTPQSTQFVGFDGTSFALKPTLAAVLSDNLEPVGKVSVVSTAPPTPPTIVPIVTAGSVLGYQVTNGGSGATQPYVLTVVGGGGSGATTGTQTIVGGVLIAVAPGQPGTGYGGGTSVTVSGGGPSGTPGGGTAQGGNGGRMTNV